MGISYYIEIGKCPVCKQIESKYHIGNSPSGWYFLLHIDPDANINTLADIKQLWKGNQIVNEYDNKVSKKEMIRIITKRSWEYKRMYPSRNYNSEEEFLRINHAEWGINNLLRPVIDGHFCIGYGNGTYAYNVGEFS